jgi:hypothetical protein
MKLTRAFPFNDIDINGHKTYSLGLTKREYFAALAMQGLLANDYHEVDLEDLVSRAIEYSDELIKQLANE